MDQIFVNKLVDWYGELPANSYRILEADLNRVIVLVAVPNSENIELVRMWVNLKKELDISIDASVNFNDVSVIDAIVAIAKRYSVVK